MKISEKTLLFLLSAVQFINVLDFMMVMPLGPDFAKALGIPTSDIGAIGGSYTAAAAISGFAGAFFLDRFDRRKALGWSLLGLVLGTACGGLAVDLHTLMAARIIAGCFGGPATALTLSIISDVFPAERRGKAIGVVMSAFAVASIFGIPLGLELARLGGWRAPFFALAGFALTVTALVISWLPPMQKHFDGLASATPFLQLLRRLPVQLSLGATAAIMIAMFSLVPNLSTFIQFNLGFPRDDLWTLYLAGGIVAFLGSRLGGRLCDRFGSATVSLLSTLLFITTLAFTFLAGHSWLSPMGIFIGFMLPGSLRGVSLQTITSRVPAPAERAQFASSQSAVQHLAAAIGAFIATRILTEHPNGALIGMNRVATISILFSALVPILLFLLQWRLGHKEL